MKLIAGRRYGAAPTDMVSPAPIGEVAWRVFTRVLDRELAPVVASSWFAARAQAALRDGVAPQDLRVEMVREEP